MSCYAHSGASSHSFGGSAPHMPSFHAPSGAHFYGMSFHEPAPSFQPSFRYTPYQASEHFSRAPQMAMPNQFNAAPRSSGYAPASERYTAPSERYVPPGSYSNAGFQQNERLQTQQFESTPASYHSAYYGNHTNSSASENFEVHGNRITRPETNLSNTEASPTGSSNFAATNTYNNQAVKSAEVNAEANKHAGQFSTIGAVSPSTQANYNASGNHEAVKSAEVYAEQNKHNGETFPTQQATLPAPTGFPERAPSNVPGVIPGTMPSTYNSANNPNYNGYLNSNSNGYGNGFGYGPGYNPYSYGSYGSGYGFNPFGSGYGSGYSYNPFGSSYGSGYGYNPFGSSYGSGYGSNPFGGYGSGYGYGSGSGIFGMLGSLFGMGGYGNGYGGYGSGYGSGFGGYGGYANGYGGYGYPGNFGNYGSYGGFGYPGNNFGYPGQNFFANNGYPNTTTYANGFPSYNPINGVTPSTIPPTIGTQPNGLPVNSVAQGIPNVPSIMPSATTINPATWNAIHHGVLGTALAQNTLRKTTGSTSPASLGALTRSAAHQQASFARAAAAAARFKRR